MVMTSFMISTLVYLACFMNFKVHIFRADPLSIMTHLTAKLETMMEMQSGRVWLGSNFGMLVVLKDKVHGVEWCPTKLWNSMALISIGTQNSRSTLSRISLYIGLVQRRSKIDIWADIFPRCSRILYHALDRADIRAPAILNQVL